MYTYVKMIASMYVVYFFFKLRIFALHNIISLKQKRVFQLS